MTEAQPTESLLASEFSEAEVRRGSIDAAMHGARLDLAVVALCPEFSRSYLQQLIEGGCVELDGQVVSKRSAKLRLGQALQVRLLPTEQSQAFQPEARELDVLFEDAHLLVLNKPPNLVVHPAAGHWNGTLLNALLAHHKAASTIPRAGIVHRLDKDTSGLMVVAKTRLCMDALIALIAKREVAREYVCIGTGTWRGVGEVLVDEPIGRDPRNRIRMAVVKLPKNTNPNRVAGYGTAGQMQEAALVDADDDPHASNWMQRMGQSFGLMDESAEQALLWLGGKPANTRFVGLDSSGSAAPNPACLVHAKLGTGRTHQIRVHMAHLGHALLGDAVYGGPMGQGIGRQALHAWKLSFVHPVTAELVSLVCPPPPDFAAAMALLGMRYNFAT